MVELFSGASVHSAALIGVMAAVTILLRFLPFWLFGGKRRTPPIISYLGRVLPHAVMGMLVVYCLKNIDFIAAPHALPEIIACAVVITLHLWKRNTLLSIAGGTVCYMILVQVIF